MSKVYRIRGFFVESVLWESLSVSVPRSFKFDVWASPVDNAKQQLEFRGRFTPSDDDEDSVYAETEEYVRRSLKALDLKP